MVLLIHLVLDALNALNGLARTRRGRGHTSMVRSRFEDWQYYAIELPMSWHVHRIAHLMWRGEMRRGELRLKVSR